MKFVSILSLLVLSAIGLAESRRRRRRRANDGKEGGLCANYSEEGKQDVECEGDELVCCDEGDKGDGVGVCRKECGEGVEEIKFEQAQGQGQEQQEQQQQQRRRRYRRRY